MGRVRKRLQTIVTWKNKAVKVSANDNTPVGNMVERKAPTIRLHLWLETGDGVYFGLGRALLLAKIEEHGSLRKAAEELGMSYRAAWGKIRRTEKVLGVSLIAQKGCKRDGHRLTEDGLILKDKYLEWLREVESGALKKAEEIFPWPVKSYSEKFHGRILQVFASLSGVASLSGNGSGGLKGHSEHAGPPAQDREV